jgi:hypothetical protein
MKLLFKILPLLTILFLFECKQKDFDGDTRGSFHWNGWINGDYHAQWQIECDVDCNSCKAGTYFDDSTFSISKSKYPKIYERCKDMPTYTSDDIDTTDKTVTPTGKISFNLETKQAYGYDPPNSDPYDLSVYQSVAAGCSTIVSINVDSSFFKQYDKIICVIPLEAQNKLSFSKAVGNDTLRLKANTNIDTIYAMNNVNDSFITSLNIYGVSDPAQPACLTGDCYKSEGNLKIVVYKEPEYKKCKLYLVNSPTFNPDTTTWKNEFNKITKQAVLKMGAPIISRINDNTWDKNNNNQFDVFMNTLNLPDDYIKDYDELFDLLSTVGEIDGCNDDNNSSIIVVNSTINVHWLIIDATVTAGQTTIGLNTVNGLQENDEIYLGPWLGIGTNNYEYLYISKILNNINAIEVSQDADLKIKGTKYSHSRYETFYYTGDRNAFTLSSCSIVKDNAAYNTFIHEFLHQDIVGHLHHVEDKNNIMYPYSSTRIGTELLYRKKPLTDTVGGITDEMQWGKIKREHLSGQIN